MKNNITIRELFFILIFFPAELITFGTSFNNVDNTNANSKKIELIVISSFNVSPVIDGFLNDEIWKKAAVLNNFVQTFPGDNTSPTFETQVLLGYTSEKLFIGVRAEDNPPGIRATFAKRDDILNDDNIKIYLDTFKFIKIIKGFHSNGYKRLM